MVVNFDYTIFWSVIIEIQNYLENIVLEHLDLSLWKKMSSFKIVLGQAFSTTSSSLN